MLADFYCLFEVIKLHDSRTNKSDNLLHPPIELENHPHIDILSLVWQHVHQTPGDLLLRRIELGAGGNEAARVRTNVFKDKQEDLIYTLTRWLIAFDTKENIPFTITAPVSNMQFGSSFVSVNTIEFNWCIIFTIEGETTLLQHFFPSSGTRYIKGENAFV